MDAKEEVLPYWPARGVTLGRIVRKAMRGWKPIPQSVVIGGRKVAIGEPVERGPAAARFQGREIAAWWRLSCGRTCVFTGTYAPQTSPSIAPDEIGLSDGGIYRVEGGAISSGTQQRRRR